jgi:UDP-glucose 4-epimerase
MSEPAFSRIILLGHTGYIGRRLAVALAAADTRVPVVGRSVGELDLTQPTAPRALEDLLDPGAAVVVCAAIKKQLGDTLDVLSQNFAISVAVARALASRPVRRVVFFSSAAVYGEDVPHDTITEETPVQPTSYYGIGKFTAERLLLRTAGQHAATSLLILRPALVYGPDEPGYYYGPSGFLQRARSGTPITLWGDGTESREFLFVDDVVGLATRLVFSGVTGVLNVVSGASYTYAAALEAIARLTGTRPVTESRPRTKDKVDHRFDNAALRRACPGFEFTTLQDGLARVAQTARAHA